MIQELRKSFFKHSILLGVFGLLLFGNIHSVHAVDTVELLALGNSGGGIQNTQTGTTPPESSTAVVPPENADVSPPNPSSIGGVSPPNSSSVGGDGSVKLTNPLKSESIPEFLIKIIEVLLVFALPFIVLYIMYAGFLLVTAQGNASEIETARSALLWAIVGGVIVLGAKLIIDVIQGTIAAF